VKEKIAQEKGWEASQQKLIYSGMYMAAFVGNLHFHSFFYPSVTHARGLTEMDYRQNPSRCEHY
jgi:hypothetical protein